MKLHFFEAKDSASPGRLQPISLRKTLLLEKAPVCSKLPPCLFVCPRTGRLTPRRLAIWFLKIAYAPLVAAAGAGASCAGRIWRGECKLPSAVKIRKLCYD
ncbi:hypothetical protein GCWU000341_02113 [Oribacterium sp. oral taxon 078 str. F0262]|nr:hypothetical protein GCWU000341_02113 [Oribacterium sp. oral taxon 078 str. F0262]